MKVEVITMYTMMICIPEIADVARFVSIMSKFPFEALLQVGSYSVDAKSIMGIFTLDRDQPIQLVAETTDEVQLEKLSAALREFLCKPVH